MLRCESPIKCVALCDKFAAIGDQSGHVSIVDIEQHQLLYTSKLHEFPVSCLTFLLASPTKFGVGAFCGIFG